MSEQILAILKQKLEDFSSYGGVDTEICRNALKEELQFYVLNFIYHHPEYNKWIMYGGSALRIIHGLDRMSVDLDFEVSNKITKKFLEELKKEIENYFVNTYGANTTFLIIKITASRGLLLKFCVGEKLNFGHLSNQVYVKIDLNHFVALKTVTERRPINHGQLSFAILTYNMGALMASKLAAIFLRGTRGVGNVIYTKKGRDIYDLLWYMGKKVVPDFDYMIAKGIDIKDPRTLFDKITLQMNKVRDVNLKNDLTPLFVNPIFIKNWLENWRESYRGFLNEYKIRTITKLQKIIVKENISTDDFSFIYFYNTIIEGEVVYITYEVSFEWIRYEKELGININENVIKLISSEWNNRLSDQQKKLITLFDKKNKVYFKKTNNIMVGDNIITKLICTTDNSLGRAGRIVIDGLTLLSRKLELDDLLK